MASFTGCLPAFLLLAKVMYYGWFAVRCPGSQAFVLPNLSKYLSWGHVDCSLRFATLQPSARHRQADEVTLRNLIWFWFATGTPVAMHWI